MNINPPFLERFLIPFRIELQSKKHHNVKIAFNILLFYFLNVASVTKAELRASRSLLTLPILRQHNTYKHLWHKILEKQNNLFVYKLRFESTRTIILYHD